MIEVSFQGPKLKIERAERHIRDLQAAIDAFLARDPYPVHIEDDPEQGVRRVRVDIAAPVPHEVALIAGDAAHNLRSALDIMICDVGASLGDHSRKARFPFATNAHDFEAELQRKVKGFPPDILALIRGLKPYDGGDDALRALHRLDIIDKHQLIVPAADHIALGASFPGEFGSARNYRTSGDRTSRVVFHLPLDRVRGQQVHVTLAITFGDGQPFHGEPMVPTLLHLAQLVKVIVQMFEAHCFR
jgi:hypothetical protein